MSKDEALRDLIERVERASQGSRELDAMIARAVGRVPMHAGFVAADDVAWDKGLGYSVPRYTSSIDAAMSLVPKGMHWCVDSDGDRYMASASVGPQPIGGELYSPHAIADAETPALALCCASLRARMGTGG